VISFHSLEDRIVKQFIATHARETVDRRDPNWMLGRSADMPLQALGRVRPGSAEVQANPRARSAVMRVAQRTHAATGVGAAAAQGRPKQGSGRVEATGLRPFAPSDSAQADSEPRGSALGGSEDTAVPSVGATS
jgi:hypothetical protein